jgi:hypothetical protein
MQLCARLMRHCARAAAFRVRSIRCAKSLQRASSRGEVEKAFASWLDGGENLARDDEIVWNNESNE